MEIKLSAIKRIENRAKEIKGAISLAQGIPSFYSHPLIRKEVIQAIKNNKVDKYSPVTGIPELKHFIGEKLLQNNMNYDKDKEIVVTSGAIEGLSAAILALVQPKQEVIILTPTYPYYEKIINMAHAKTITVPLNEDKGWKLNIKLLLKKITKNTKAIILCNPNNPTGSILSKKELITIAIIAQRRNIVVITDDVYQEFYFNDKEIFNLCSQKEFKRQIIRIVSFSKDFALSGWRIGFLHGHKDNIEKIIPIHDNLTNCAPVVSQYAALAGLKNQEIIVPNYMNQYAKRRKIMGNFLNDCKDYLSFNWPLGAYYFFPKIIGINNTEALCFDMLEKTKVAAVPGEEFGIGGKGHIRLCFGKSEEEIIEGMERISKYFKTFLKSFKSNVQ